jgi:hypothetical protein
MARLPEGTHGSKPILALLQSLYGGQFFEKPPPPQMARIGGKAVKTSAKAYILYVIMHSFIIYVIMHFIWFGSA